VELKHAPVQRSGRTLLRPVGYGEEALEEQKLNSSRNERDRPWIFNYPVSTRLEPGSWLPRRISRLEGNQFLLRLLAYFKVTNRPGLVQWHYKVNERIVELPFVLRNLDEADRRVLDVGCAESILPLDLAHRGFKVWGIDQRNYPLTHPNLEFIVGDICRLSFENDFFDVAISLSTVEHVGLGFYGDSRREHGDVAAIRELHRVLKPGAKLILTAPYGRRCEAWQRVYDSRAIAELLAVFRVEHVEYYHKVGEAWLEAEEQQASEAESADETHAVVLIVARKA